MFCEYLQAVSFPVQNGVLLSRARVLFFKHNDTADLEKVLQKVAAEDVRNKCAAVKASCCSPNS